MSSAAGMPSASKPFPPLPHVLARSTTFTSTQPAPLLTATPAWTHTGCGSEGSAGPETPLTSALGGGAAEAFGCLGRPWVREAVEGGWSQGPARRPGVSQAAPGTARWHRSGHSSGHWAPS